MCLCVHTRVHLITQISEYVILKSTFLGRSVNCKAEVTSALQVVVEAKVRVCCPHQSSRNRHCIQTSKPMRIVFLSFFNPESASHLNQTKIHDTFNS